jgi:hypothetical protein
LFADSDRSGGYCPSQSQYWSPGTHETRLQSVGWVRSARTLDYQVNGHAGQIRLPDGHRWDIDAHGIRAVCGPDDYHISATDLLSSREIPAVIARNAARRREIAAQLLVEQAQCAGVLVCLADSLCAGNCRAASEDWARKHDLDLVAHYPAPEILARGNGDIGRVRLAIRAAIARTERENAQGFCEIASHRVA